MSKILINNIVYLLVIYCGFLTVFYCEILVTFAVGLLLEVSADGFFDDFAVNFLLLTDFAVKLLYSIV